MDVLTAPISFFQKAEQAFDLSWKLMNYWTEKEASKKEKNHPHFPSVNTVISHKESRVMWGINTVDLFLYQKIQSVKHRTTTQQRAGESGGRGAGSSFVALKMIVWSYKFP